MAATTPLSTHCSVESGRAFILDPSASRLLATWLIGLHALAATAVLAADAAGLLKLGLLVALAAHGRWRRPRRPPRIVHNRNGSWSVPGRGELGLRLAPATRYGDWWVDLRLAAPGRGLRIVLLRDQVDCRAWWALQATLRQSSASRLP